jgi:GATA zinc finger
MAQTASPQTPTFMLSGVWAAQLPGDEDVQSPDVLLGAYLLGHLHPHTCEHCGTHETPQWRKGWVSDVLQRSVLLCNACGIKYHKNQYCSYCREIYGKDVREGAEWIGCNTCGKLVHRKCEEYWMHGSQTKTYQGAAYCCPNCIRGQHAPVPGISQKPSAS